MLNSAVVAAAGGGADVVTKRYSLPSSISARRKGAFCCRTLQ